MRVALVVLAIILAVVSLSAVISYLYHHPMRSLHTTSTTRLIFTPGPGTTVLRLDIEPKALTPAEVRSYLGSSTNHEDKVYLGLKVSIYNLGGETVYVPVIAAGATMCRCRFFSGPVVVETERGKALWAYPIVCPIPCPLHPLHPGTALTNNTWILILEPSEPLRATVRVYINLCRCIGSLCGCRDQPCFRCDDNAELKLEEVFVIEIPKN